MTTTASSGPMPRHGSPLSRFPTSSPCAGNQHHSLPLLSQGSRQNAAKAPQSSHHHTTQPALPSHHPRPRLYAGGITIQPARSQWTIAMQLHFCWASFGRQAHKPPRIRHRPLCNHVMLTHVTLRRMSRRTNFCAVIASMTGRNRHHRSPPKIPHCRRS